MRYSFQSFNDFYYIWQGEGGFEFDGKELKTRICWNAPCGPANDFTGSIVFDNPVTPGPNPSFTLTPSFYFNHITPAPNIMKDKIKNINI